MSNGPRACRVCDAVGVFPEYTVREMMFGTRETFGYFQCGGCGCLQIASVPTDLARHYPKGYYSFGVIDSEVPQPPLLRWLAKQRVRTAVFGRGYRLNALAKHFVPLPKALFYRHGGLPTGEVLKRAGVFDFSARCLDVGCGAFSRWLHDLWQLGFKNLVGVDPYIEADLHHGPIGIYKRELADVDGSFDLITFHHSLEHMVDQRAALRTALEHLSPGGTLLVRVPLVSSLVWERYGVNWVELDAPRHLYLHSINSLKAAATAVGLALVDIVYDSLPFEFYGSELYQRDIPLNDPRSAWLNESSSYFSAEEMASFAALATRVNAEGSGGRAGFYFRAAA